MACGYVRTTAVRIEHQFSCKAAQMSRRLPKCPVELCSSLSFSWSLLQIYAEVSGAPKFNYSISQTLKHPECTSITAGAFSSIWECSCKVWEHFAYIERGLGACRCTYKHRWGRPECLGRFHVASGPIYILLMSPLLIWTFANDKVSYQSYKKQCWLIVYIESL
jgi:hypothetical protein